MLNGWFADPDGTKMKGVAVTGLTGTGTWQYSAGSGWKPVGAVSAATALLLTDTQSLRFLPAKDWVGAAEVTFKARDRSFGTGGTRADTTAGNSFSLSDLTDQLMVTPVNDRPVLDVTRTPARPALAGTETDPAGTPVSALLGSVAADIDSPVVGIVVTGRTGAGTWVWSSDGSTWTALSAPRAGTGFTLDPTDLVRYVPVAGTKETATLSYRAWDESVGTPGQSVAGVTGTGFGLASETAYVSVGNTAPILDPTGTPVFKGVPEDTVGGRGMRSRSWSRPGSATRTPGPCPGWP